MILTVGIGLNEKSQTLKSDNFHGWGSVTYSKLLKTLNPLLIKKLKLQILGCFWMRAIRSKTGGRYVSAPTIPYSCETNLSGATCFRAV